jgi:hypothetical protein
LDRNTKRFGQPPGKTFALIVSPSGFFEGVQRYGDQHIPKARKPMLRQAKAIQTPQFLSDFRLVFVLEQVQERLAFPLLGKAEKSHDPVYWNETLQFGSQFVIKGPQMKISTGKSALTNRTETGLKVKKGLLAKRAIAWENEIYKIFPKK